MSTYNGEKYVEKQIRSIMEQSFIDWTLFIRDDGSTDNTISIIKKLMKLDSRINLINDGNNIGVKKSFFSLLRRVDADYYFFSDQDDIWKNDKIQIMVNKMFTDRPLLVHSNMELIDSDDQLLTNKLKKDTVHTDFFNLMTKNNVTGCTMAINKNLREIAVLEDDAKIVMHDWWLGLYASYYGEIVYIPEPLIMYRKHENNVMGTEYRLHKKIVSMIFDDRKLIEQSILQAELFKKGINDNEIDKYVDVPRNVINRISWAKFVSAHRNSFSKKLLSFISLVFWRKE